MDLIKKLFPYSFGVSDIVGLIVKILAYMIVSALLGWVLSLIPLVGGIAAWVVGIYCTIGWVIAILVFLKVIK